MECKKVRYNSEKSALEDIPIIKKNSKRSKVRSAYLCKHCKAWHLTSQISKEEYKSIIRQRELRINELTAQVESLKEEVKPIREAIKKEDRAVIKADIRVKELNESIKNLNKKYEKLQALNYSLMAKNHELEKKLNPD